jgi:hypothetical protein
MKRLTFALIDAKERPVVGVNHENPSRENAKVTRDAELEYLRGLKKLQEEIVAKYEPKLVEQKPFNTKDFLATLEDLDNDDDFWKVYTKENLGDLYYT